MCRRLWPTNCCLSIKRWKTTASKKDQYSKYRWKKKNTGPQFPLPDIQGELLWGIHPVLLALLAGRRLLHGAFFKDKVDNDRLQEIRRLCAAGNFSTMNVTGPIMDELAGNHPHQGVCLDVSPLQVPNVEIDLISRFCTRLHCYEYVKHVLMTVAGICLSIQGAVLEAFGVLGLIAGEDMVHKLVLSELVTGSPLVWMLPYRVQDTMNMGAVFRSAFYFGVDRIILPKHYSASLNSVVSKASAGAMEMLDIQKVTSDHQLTELIKKWKQVGGRVVGTSCDGGLHTSVVPAHSYHSNHPILLIIGNEALGMSEQITDLCDVLLYINSCHSNNIIDGHVLVDSLNVSVAAGIILHTITKNRR